MRIALDEIDPQIADKAASMAAAHPIRTPVPRKPRPHLSRRRRLALAASLVAPPIIGFQLATLSATVFHAATGLLPWVVWFGTWALGTGLGCRATLKGRLASRRAAFLMTLIALVAPALGLATAIYFNPSGPSFTFVMLWLLVSLTSALAGGRLALNVASQSATVTELQPENMKEIFAALSLTRAERVYCDVLLFLARAQPPNAETEQTMRETLQQLNDLMQSSRQLEEQRLSLLPLLGANVVPELRAEYDRLKLRQEGTSDQITRASLEQSRRMVVSRIEDAHNLQTGLERLNTQQEAITQTISSTLSALGRMQLTSGTRAEYAMNDVAQTVTEMNQQTIAVESAVEEVLTLRSSN